MPITSRPGEMGSNRMNGKRPFRPVTDDRRPPRGNGNGSSNGGTAARPTLKPAPTDSTNAENFYYLKQMNARTPMVIVLADGEEIHGCIEWYDRTCIKINRDGAPNLLIQKQYIKYLFKAEER